MAYWPQKKQLDFGGNQDPDPGIILTESLYEFNIHARLPGIRPV